MEKLISGLHKFRSETFVNHETLFKNLVNGQKPDVLFITCSDSRVNPNLLTNTNPGELFIIRNAGNIVPPYQIGNGEAATIEFAVRRLKVKNIIICGHSHCGAINGLVHPEAILGLPALEAWLSNSKEVRTILDNNYPALSPSKTINVATQENVLVQVQNLKTHPCIQEEIAGRNLKIHAWVYKFETGDVFNYDPVDQQFHPIVEPNASREKLKARFTQELECI
jgi:carbonic anhydrase